MHNKSVNVFHKYICRVTALLSACCKTYCFYTVKAVVLRSDCHAVANELLC